MYVQETHTDTSGRKRSATRQRVLTLYHKGDSSAAACLSGAQTGVRGPPGGHDVA